MSAKELLDRYSEYLNQTKFDPTIESSTLSSSTDFISSPSLLNSQIFDQLLPIIGFCIYFGIRLLVSIFSWVNRWRLFRRMKKSGIMHSMYYTMLSSTVSGIYKHNYLQK
jgi:hypothetical protein